MNDLVHLYKNTFRDDLRIFFLIIPILVFILTVAILTTKRPENQVISSIATPNVLGENTDK